MRGRNTESLMAQIDHRMTNYKQKRYVLMKFFHKDKHIVFSNIGEGRRRMEAYDGVEVIVGIS